MTLIPRLHLFELEDQPWFPAIIRNFGTDYIRFIEAKFALHRPVIPLLSEALRATKAHRIIDLCSGGGGPMLAVQKSLATEGFDIGVTLTDRFPNAQAFEWASTESQGKIAFAPEAVDARAVPAHLTGFRTIFNAFHHFRPEDAIVVLRDAAKADQPIGIFEIPNRTLRNLVPLILLTPFLVALATPFIRPFRWSRLFYTYLVPLVPLTCWWDGIVSQLRAYTPLELKHLANTAAIDTFTWSAGKVPVVSVPGELTYLLGYPPSKEHRNFGVVAR